MESASFIVETSDWKSLFKMRYDGKKEKLMAFGSLVEGTVHYKIGDLFPELKKSVEPRAEIEEKAKELASLARKAVKAAGIEKDYKKFAGMWVIAEALQASGVKIFPEKKELKSILKKI